MRRVAPSPDWPESWRVSYDYDQLEVYGARADVPYTRGYTQRHRRAVAAIKTVTPPPARVLDVAAAQGNFSIALAEAGYDVTWNDLRADLADYVALKADSGAITYAPGNIVDLQLAEFDAVLMTEVIEHVAHPDQFLRRVADLVRPGGHLIMTTPNGRYFRNGLPRFSDFTDTSAFEDQQYRPDADGHIFLLHPDEIRDLADRSGLKLVSLDFFNNPLTTGHAKTSRLACRLPDRLVERGEALTSRWAGALGQRVNSQAIAVLHRPAH